MKEKPDEMYCGWELRWTGWKGLGSRGEYRPRSEYVEHCSICRKEMRAGELAVRHWESDNVEHFACVPKPWILVGQWVGYFDGRKFMYASTPGQEGPYHRGDCFSISPTESQVIVSDDTPESVRETAKAECLTRLKKLIDMEESTPSGYWDRAMAWTS